MFKRTSLPAVIAAVMLLSSCAEGWTDDTRREYRAQCITEAAGMYTSSARAESYCDCNLKVMTKYFGSREDVNQHKYRQPGDSAAVHQELEACSLNANAGR